MQQRIYIDTSVPGGYFDIEFEADTKLFFERIQQKDFIVHISEISKGELLPAPQKVKDLVTEIPSDCLVILDFTKEAQELAENYQMIYPVIH